MGTIAGLVADVLDGLAAHPNDNGAVEAAAAETVAELCRKYPIYPEASLFAAPETAAKDAGSGVP